MVQEIASRMCRLSDSRQAHTEHFTSLQNLRPLSAPSEAERSELCLGMLQLLEESISHVCAGALEDTMESFFLSETAKYLYLLHSNATALPDFYLFSTEGHLLPILGLEEGTRQTPLPAEPSHRNCLALCQERSQEELLKVCM